MRLQLARAERSRDDTSMIQHDYHAMRACGQTIMHMAEALVGATGRHVVGEQRRDKSCIAAIGQAGGEPISLPRSVIVDLVEAVALEPPRGPGTEVSLVVVTVDDDLAVRCEHGRRGLR